MCRVSVIIPAYNEESTISGAIESVLNQTFTDYEIIIVDDCSTDDTSAVAKSYSDENIHVYKHEKNKGGAAARNTGIKNAHGEYCAFLDADDIWHSEKLEKQLLSINEKNESIACYCDVKRKSQQNIVSNIYTKYKNITVPREGGEELIPYILSREFSLGGSSTLIVEMNVVKRLDGFDERFPRHQDWEFLIRVVKSGEINYVTDELVTKRHTGNPSLEDVVESKKLLLKKFSKEVVNSEQNGFPIIQSHQLALARNFLTKDEYIQSTKTFLNTSCHPPSHYVIYGYYTFKHICDKIQSKTNI